uniref:Uncharacterized protein n=1 Tax=Tetraodon nigroviridis TaxID=99883 RepID=H3BWD3_TETNG
MASLHPAFHFHQGEKFREQLDKLEAPNRFRVDAQVRPLTSGHTPRQGLRNLASADKSLSCNTMIIPCSQKLCEHALFLFPWICSCPAMHIEEIVLRSVTRTTIEKEYNFQVKWSDSSSSYVTKTHLELENFLLKLPKNNCSEGFEKSILRLLNKAEEADSCEVEEILREKFLSAPSAFKQIRKVCSFFSCGSS